MRAFKISTVLALATMLTISTALVAPAKSIRLPLPPVGEVVSQHPIIGSWVETTAVGMVPVSFKADGTVTMAFPETAFGSLGSSYTGTGVGTWEAVGVDGVIYSVVQTVTHGTGVPFGTVTTEGYLALSPDGTSFTDDGQLTIVTVRDSMNQISSVTRLGPESPVATATRTGYGQTGVALVPETLDDTPAPIQGGCNTCR